MDRIFDFHCSNLNEIETKVLNDCARIAAHYGEGPYFCADDIKYKELGLTINQLKGYLSQLTHKCYIEKLEPGYYFDYLINPKKCGLDENYFG